MGYEIKECLLSPIQFGIPNHRLRYYMMARRISQDQQDYTNPLYTQWPFNTDLSISVPELSNFIQDEADADMQYRVPEKDITKCHKFRFGECFLDTLNYKRVDLDELDIVRPCDNRTSCITKVCRCL